MLPLFRLHDFLSESLAHSGRISGLLLTGVLVIVAVSVGTLLRRHARKSWVGEATKNPAGRLIDWAVAVRVAALVLIGIAALDPRLGRGSNDAARSNEQIVLLLDRSRSMLAADAEPTRFALARDVAANVIERAQGAAIAIVSFAGDARIESPLSRDERQLREQLEALAPEEGERSGTQLAQGLMLAMDCFASRFVGPKRLIVLTDGETHEPLALAGARIPKGVDVLFLGIGDSIHGARIPVKGAANDGRANAPQYLTYEGKTVWTKSRPKNLDDLAHRLRGHSQMITSVAEGSRIISKARGDVQESLHRQRLATATPIYSPFLFAALVLLVLEWLLPSVARLSWRRNSRRHDRHTAMAIGWLPMLVWGFAGGASPRADIAETYNRGVEAYRSAAWTEAEAQFRRAMASGEEPISGRACFNLANAQYQWVRKGGMSKQEAMARLEECIACYRRCIQKNQRSADARANLQMVYALLKHIERQDPKKGQSGTDDKGQASATPPSNHRPAERGEGEKPGESREGSSPKSHAGDASRPPQPGPRARSPARDASEGEKEDELTDGAAELRRIRDQARRRGSGKKPTLVGTTPAGPPW